jgi:hypothetical protein
MDYALLPVLNKMIASFNSFLYYFLLLHSFTLWNFILSFPNYSCFFIFYPKYSCLLIYLYLGCNYFRNMLCSSFYSQTFAADHYCFIVDSYFQSLIFASLLPYFLNYLTFITMSFNMVILNFKLFALTFCFKWFEFFLEM